MSSGPHGPIFLLCCSNFFIRSISLQHFIATIILPSHGDEGWNIFRSSGMGKWAFVCSPCRVYEQTFAAQICPAGCILSRANEIITGVYTCTSSNTPSRERMGFTTTADLLHPVGGDPRQCTCPPSEYLLPTSSPVARITDGLIPIQSPLDLCQGRDTWAGWQGFMVMVVGNFQDSVTIHSNSNIWVNLDVLKHLIPRISIVILVYLEYYISSNCWFTARNWAPLILNRRLGNMPTQRIRSWK